MANIGVLVFPQGVLNKLITSAIILNLFFLFTFESCKSPTAPKSYRLSLSVTDVSCTEAWIKLTMNNNTTLPANVEIKRNGNSIFSFNLTSRDTTVYDSTLLPNQTYTYQAKYDKGYPTEISETITAKTMDTTSSNFTWQTTVFGDGFNNSFSDVEVVSDTSIWAVGLFSIQNSGTYNVAHWDGKKWNYYRLSAYNQQNVLEFIAPLTGVKVFSDTDMWFADGNVYHWNGAGTILTAYWIGGYQGNPSPVLGPNQGISKLWGTSSNNLYGCGINGGLAYFDGIHWQQIQSGTTLNIQDIWGANDPITGKEQILCMASNMFTPDGNAILEITNNQAQIISNNGLTPYYFSSIWFKDSKIGYIGGSGDFKSYNFLTNPNWIAIWPKITPYYTNLVRGNDINDIVFCGSYGDIAHYNGIRWTDYLGNGLQNFYGELTSISIKGNSVCAVGYGTFSSNIQAVIILGRRVN